MRRSSPITRVASAILATWVLRRLALEYNEIRNPTGIFDRRNFLLGSFRFPERIFPTGDTLRVSSRQGLSDNRRS